MGWLSDAGSYIKNNASSIVHTGLDLLGFVPVLGAIPDAANALLYAIEGDYGNALLSAAAAVPLVGDTVALARTGVKATKLVKAGKTVKGVKALNILDNGKALIKSLKGKMLEGAELLKKLDIQEMFAAIKKKIKKLIGGGKCFTGDMLVLTEKGYQAIQEIKAGDKVYSRDEETGETGLKRVGKITQRKSHTIYTIEINDSTIIKTTAYHPFYIEERGWVNAINLVEGDKLSTKEGIGRITYIGKERREEPVVTYNFQVEDWVSYFVSEENIYVHNGGCGSLDVPKGSIDADRTLIAGEDWNSYFREQYGYDNVNWETAFDSPADIIDMPSSVTRMNPEGLHNYLESNNLSPKPLGGGSKEGIPFQSGGGYNTHFREAYGDSYIQYHPGGGHHGEAPYYKVSSGNTFSYSGKKTGTQRFNLDGTVIKD